MFPTRCQSLKRGDPSIFVHRNRTAKASGNMVSKEDGPGLGVCYHGNTKVNVSNKVPVFKEGDLCIFVHGNRTAKASGKGGSKEDGPGTGVCYHGNTKVNVSNKVPVFKEG